MHSTRNVRSNDSSVSVFFFILFKLDATACPVYSIYEQILLYILKCVLCFGCARREPNNWIHYIHNAHSVRGRCFAHIQRFTYTYYVHFTIIIIYMIQLWVAVYNNTILLYGYYVKSLNGYFKDFHVFEI